MSSRIENTQSANLNELTHESDAELIEETRLGNEAAYAELWQRHAQVGLGVARQATTAFDPEDLLAEAYANILEAITNGHGPTGAFRPYLTTVVRNVAGRWARSLKETTVDDLSELLDQATSSDGQDDLDDLDDNQLVIRAFRSLRPRWQEILWLLEVNGLKPREVAQQLNLKPNSVSALATRAREGLREAWIKAHLKNRVDDPECKDAIAAFPALVRGSLPTRQHTSVLAHLEYCESCSKVYAEAEAVASRLRSSAIPSLSGWAQALHSLRDSFTEPQGQRLRA
ncbi:sigma-70 family RNA polymerase sigma factor [Leucobacter viscericola]|uniref:Sigma-70 family RNA polymerase sigma factor n=1 Tax=Leucobacter viscericola TaxID=2714935 RepID=A0A6G7XG14_9MICO|nr:sigma-70 family RNA polymerase sigma factor [Leucobacter viscericola]QIK63318.1 sigma-70 family RNA polymerase sigma factor [Leucobacter viscericola]